MQRSCIRRAAGEHGAAAEGMLGREQELVARLRELLPPSPTPIPTGDGSSWSSGILLDNINECSVKALRGACSHASAMAEAPLSGGRRRRRGSKRARDEEHDELAGGGADAKPRCGNKTRRRNKQESATLVTTLPDFDGYQWRKYGQKQIERAKYLRSYYRCTNSTDQGCPAKRTVQRNDGGDGGPPKYTVVYIARHTCKTVESVAPVILETTVRTKKPAADNDNATAHVLAPDDVVVPANSSTTGSSSSGTTNGIGSPAISSEIAWTSDANSSEQGYCYPHVDGLFAVDDWDPTTPAAAALLQETDFTGPIRSPVHIAAADGWIDELLVNEPINIPSNCHLFGF